jgi:hypothetical protein
LTKTYCWVYYTIRDGDTSYGEHEAVIVDGDFDKNDERLWKLLLFKLLGDNEFGMDEDELEEEYDKENKQLTESGGYRIGEVEGIDVIPQADFEVLKKYMGFTEVTNDFEEKVKLT